MKMLSIIIPIYNVEKYLYTCLNSISCQTDSEFEVLLVDDGSSDRSGLICDEYEKRDGRFKAIHIKNSGPSIARNTGLKHANGDLITFVDSDDWVPLNYVETIRKSIKNYDLLYFCHSEYHVDGSYTIYERPLTVAQSTEEIETLLLTLKLSPQKIEYCNFTVNKCFRRSILEENNIFFPEGLSTREDEIFTNQYLGVVKSICYIPDNLYVYRISDTGLTARNKSQAQIFRFVEEMIKTTGWQSNELKDFSVKRIVDFFMMGSSLKPFPSLQFYKQVYRYYRQHNNVKLGIVAKLSFDYPILLSMVNYYILSSLKYIKQCLR